MSLPSKLKQLRAKHGLTQEALGKKISVSRSTIAGYETRERQPSYEKLVSIADVFQVSVDYLLEDEVDAATILSREPDQPIDQRFLTLYRNLNNKSKEDAYEYLRLLELREKYL